MLKPGGKLLVLYMAWLPYEDYIAGKSEELVLKYSPVWSGAREKMHPIQIPDCYNLKFNVVYHEEYTLNVHFTRETWNGRMKACRGVGASLSDAELQAWEEEHLKMLSEIAPEEFDVKHYAALAELQVKKQTDFNMQKNKVLVWKIQYQQLFRVLWHQYGFVLSYRQFNEKGFLFNNAYIFASKQERETMNKKPHYKQSGICFFADRNYVFD